MSATFTFNPANSIGQVRSFIQDNNVAPILNGVLTGVVSGGTILQFSTKSFAANDLIGQLIYPNIASAMSFKIVSNTVSALTIRGDVTGMASAGVSATINQAVFTDTEINNFLTQGNSNVLMAASIGLRALAANQALLAKKFDKKGIGGLMIEKRDLKQITELATSYEERAKAAPASQVSSFNFGDGERTDDFETDNFNEFGADTNEYNKV